MQAGHSKVYHEVHHPPQEGKPISNHTEKGTSLT